MPKKITYNSPVVLTFSLISLAALIISGLSGGRIMDGFFTLYLTSAKDPLQYVRLFTHVLGHASWQHYSGNITLLLLIGPGTAFNALFDVAGYIVIAFSVLFMIYGIIRSRKIY